MAIVLHIAVEKTEAILFRHRRAELVNQPIMLLGNEV